MAQNFDRFLEKLKSKIESKNVYVYDINTEIEGKQLYSKGNTLEILKDRDIDLSKVKKIVSLNAQGHLVVDNGALSDHIFISNKTLDKGFQALFKANQLVFVQDKNDNNNILIYKILFVDQNEEVFARWETLGSMPLSEFNDMFIDCGLFCSDQQLNITTIKTLLMEEKDSDNEEQPISFTKKLIMNYLNDADDEEITGDQEEGYLIFWNGQHIIMENVDNEDDAVVISLDSENITHNKVFYLKKYKVENDDSQFAWKILKLKVEKEEASLLNQPTYKLSLESDSNILTNEQFKLLKALNATKTPGFTVNYNPQGDQQLAWFFKKEQKTIAKSAIKFLTLEPDENSTSFEFVGADVFAKLKNYSIENLYSLEIEDNENKIKIKKITFSQSQEVIEEVIFEQQLSLKDQIKWNNKSFKHKKVYFSKIPDLDNDCVKIWVFNDELKTLRCIKQIRTSYLRERFKNNNLFPINFNGIFLQTNGSQIKAERRQVKEQKPPQPTVTKLPAAIVNDVINLEWNNIQKLWDLNITTANYTLNKKIELQHNHNQLLKKLKKKNGGCDTVILFNKRDGSFLRAYYVDKDNQTIPCSENLTNIEKMTLSNINKQVRQQILKPRQVIPIYSCSWFDYLTKKKTFTFRISQQKCQLLCKDEFNIPLEVELGLTPEEVKHLSKLIGNQLEFALTFEDKKNHFNFKSISFKKFRTNDYVLTFNEKAVSNSSSATVDSLKLMKKIGIAIKDHKSLKPHNNDDVISSQMLWDKDTVDKVNETPVSINTIPILKQSARMEM